MIELLFRLFGAAAETLVGWRIGEISLDFPAREPFEDKHRYRDRCIACVCFSIAILGSAWFLLHWLLPHPGGFQ